MSNANRKKQDVITESEQLESAEEIKELKQRIREDETVGELLLEIEENYHSKSKLKEIHKLISDAKKQVEKAERLLKDVICDRESEDRKIEDAILLSDGVMKVQEKPSEAED